MFDLLLTASFAPFTTALGLLFGLLALEIFFALVGLSLMGGDADVDVDVADVPDFADLAGMGVNLNMPDLADYDIPDVSADAQADTEPDTGAGDVGALAWLGLGKVPFMIWLAALLLGFGGAGLIVQTVWSNILGFALPLVLIVPAAIAVGVWFTKTFSAVFAALLPKTESTSLSTRRYGGHKGVVTQGTAERGRPAEVKLIDRHGNLHYLRAEPAHDDHRIPAGTDVIILRNIRTGVLRLVALG